MKIWSKLFLVLATGMMMFSSCLETIEPEGLSDLRGAKADLLRAQTALQEAQAAKVNAEAALVLAEAKVQEAVAKQKEAEIAYIEVEIKQMEAMVEYQNLLNEREAIINAGMEAANAAEAEAARIANELALAELEARLAEIEAAKAEAERAAQVAAENLKADLLAAQTKLLEAQAAYEVAMKDLAAAKVTLTPAQWAYIAPFDLDVKLAQSKVDGLTTDLENVAKSLADALVALDKAQAEKITERELKNDVIEAEAELEAAKEAAEIAEGLLEIDEEITAWEAKRTELVEAKEALARQLAQYKAEQAERAKEYRDSMDIMMPKLTEYQNYTGYVYYDATDKFSTVPVNPRAEIYLGEEIKVEGPKDDEGNSIWGDIYLSPSSYFFYDDASNITDVFDRKVERLNSYSVEVIEEEIAIKEKILEDYKKTYEAALTQYDDANAAYTSGDIVSYLKKYEEGNYDEETDIDALVKTYNDAVVAFEKAFEDYEAEMAKYVPADDKDKRDALWAEYETTVDALTLTKVKAYQAARETFNKAEVEAKKLYNTYNRARQNLSAASDAAYVATGFDNSADMKAHIDAYDADAKAQGEAFAPTVADKAKYEACKERVDALATLEKAAKDAFDAWAACFEDKNVDNDLKAYTVMVKAQGEADTAFETKEAEAYAKYVDAIAALDATATNLIDPTYKEYLDGQLKSARWAVQQALTYNDDYVLGLNHYIYCESYSYAAAEYKSEHITGLDLIIPEFFVDPETKKLKTVEVADFVSVEYFGEDHLTDMAENIFSAVVYCDVLAYNADYTSGAWSSWYYPVDYVYNYPADVPFEVPTAEEYADFLEAAMADAMSHVISLMANDGYTNVIIEDSSVETIGTAANIYNIQVEIEEAEALIARIGEIPAYIEAIEAAKAEFEAFAAEKVAEIDAMGAELAEVLPRLAAELEAVEADYAEFTAKDEALDTQIGVYVTLIDAYCNGMTYEAFVAYLEGQYESALEYIVSCEYALEDAQQKLEAFCADEITAVEAAQAKYDKVAADLAEALAELEAAADALEEAMAAIGEGTVEEEAPEAPETPETPAE